jgi:hypothetical protein
MVFAFSSTFSDNRKLIALSGDEATCGQCKGTYKIFGTGQGISEKGRDAVVDGDLVLCPCGKNRVIVGANPGIFLESRGSAGTVSPSMPASPSASASHLTRPAPVNSRYDLFFHAKHERTGEDLCHVRYQITLEDGRQFIGVTDEKGHTQKVSADTALIAKIEIPYYDNSAAHTSSEPEPCSC